MLKTFKSERGESIKSLVAQEGTVDSHQILNLGCWEYVAGKEDEPEAIVLTRAFIPEDDEGNELPHDELTGKVMMGEDVQLIISNDGLDSLCYRLGRRPPSSYAKECPAWLRSVNVNHWLSLEQPRELVVHSFDGTLVSIMTLEHVPTASEVLISAADSNLKFRSWKWLPTMSRFDLADREDGRIVVRVRNSPTGFGAIHLSAGFRPENSRRTIRIPVDWSRPHRWSTEEELAESFSEATSIALALANELKEAFESIENDQLDIDWAEALRTAQEFAGAHPLPAREIKKALPEEGTPGTWGALVVFFLDVAHSLSSAGKDTVAEAIEYATGRLVLQLAEE